MSASIGRPYLKPNDSTVTLVVALGAGWWLWKQREADQLNREDLSRALVDATRARTDTEAKNVELRKEVDQLTGERDALTHKTTELASTLEQREAELARLTATSRSLEEKLAAEIKRGDVKVTQTDGRIQVDLIDKVLFDSAQAEVSPRGEEVLTRLGAILKGVEDRQIQISGHTDDSPITLPELKAKFAQLPIVGEVRGVGLMGAIEFVADREKKTRFAPGLTVGARVSKAARNGGLIVRAMPHGDILGFAPPLVTTKAEVDEIIAIAEAAVRSVMDDLVRAGEKI